MQEGHQSSFYSCHVHLEIPVLQLLGLGKYIARRVCGLFFPHCTMVASQELYIFKGLKRAGLCIESQVTAVLQIKRMKLLSGMVTCRNEIE